MTSADLSDELSSLPQADQDAIGLTLISLMTGFRERRPTLRWWPGTWLIVSEMYNDANREETYAGPS